jgi:hypothetical protein
VLVIDVDHPGKLKASTEAYDQKVAGSVAGAHGLGSGVRLGGSLYDSDSRIAPDHLTDHRICHGCPRLHQSVGRVYLSPHCRGIRGDKTDDPFAMRMAWTYS